jgi:hypothetical protein
LAFPAGLKTNNFGFGNTGAMLFLPLSPRVQLAIYDGGAYVARSKENQRMKLSDPEDVATLNDLQFIKAGQNIYFSEWETRHPIAAGLDAVKHLRRQSWFEVSVFVHEETNTSGDRYRRATAEERKNAQTKMIALAATHPAPLRWPRKFPFRNPVRTTDTRTGAGHIRSKELMELMRNHTSPTNASLTSLAACHGYRLCEVCEVHNSGDGI